MGSNAAHLTRPFVCTREGLYKRKWKSERENGVQKLNSQHRTSHCGVGFFLLLKANRSGKFCLLYRRRFLLEIFAKDFAMPMNKLNIFCGRLIYSSKLRHVYLISLCNKGKRKRAIIFTTTILHARLCSVHP